MLCDLFDAGLIVGQSVRSVSDACKLALTDATIFTSLIESRLLAGSEVLFDRFQRKFRAATQRHWRRLVAAVEEARTQERLQFGDTVFLLEPNVKRSPGGLRDIQLLRWVGYARYGQASADTLQRAGLLAPDDHMALRRAAEFLLRVRNELQFHAGKAQDVLDRAEQVRQAEVFGFAATEGMLPVEHFMREYFRNTSAVLHIVPRFVEGARHRGRLSTALAPLLSRRLDENYRIGPKIDLRHPRGLAKLAGEFGGDFAPGGVGKHVRSTDCTRHVGSGPPGGSSLARRGHSCSRREILVAVGAPAPLRARCCTICMKSACSKN